MSIFEKWKQGLQWSKIQDEIGEPPWEYNFLYNLPEREYPKYLAKIFNYRTGEKLPLKWDFKNQAWIIDKNKCKTFNQKIQWLKLYGVTPLMRNCTDKVKVRDYVKEKIGEEYLKPVLQIIPNDTSVIANHNSILGGEAIREEVKQVIRNENSGIKPEFQNVDCRGTEKAVVPRNDREPNDFSTYFDQIDFDKLPQAFVIKCNHGCKWQYRIKKKDDFLSNNLLIDIVKRNMTGWLEQEYWCFEGFEMQYRVSHRVKPPIGNLGAQTRLCDGIEPKILIEEFIPESSVIEIYCFNEIPEIIAYIKNTNDSKISVYRNDFSYCDLVLKKEDKEHITKIPVDKFLKQAVDLSKKLSKGFIFVRVDFIVYQNKLYFEELTFTPYSGFSDFGNKWEMKLGEFIKI